MQNALAICSRRSFSPSANTGNPFLALYYTTRRFRSGNFRGKKQSSSPASLWSSSSYNDKYPRTRVNASKPVEKPQLNLSPDNPQEIIDYFKSHVEEWSKSPKLQSRLQSFGIPRKDIDPLLRRYVKSVCAGELSSTQAYERYNLVRFGLSSEDDFPDDYTDIVMTAVLYDWASDPSNQKTLESVITPSTIVSIRNLFEAAQNKAPPDAFPEARKLRRKVYMHVGPTNSGKTHNALRALAAANTGVYAGPLRLLAHEIWLRLNRGEIVPLGAEQDPVDAPIPTPAVVTADSALDAAPVVSATRGNPKYARPCNMLTGEERRIVHDFAPLLSCTVEMLSAAQPWDVAVVDEIQMIADAERGYAWTSAVIGLNAKELHLCGEETAVPIVEALLKDTEDELVVKRYQRLTPLSIDKPLEGDLTKIEKGDCVVAFSRKRIFSLKSKIESATQMRCAVVYGKLPPELRSEQADLFNDPKSGYDVIVGSDAIGMGLNLKIRRVIFEKVSKFNGKELQYLSLSQTKQIAGRAGRYGMLGDEKPGGFVTSLDKPDLPFIQEKLDQKPQPLPTARLGPDYEMSQRIARILPLGTSLEAILNAQIYVSKTPPAYRYSTSSQVSSVSTKIQTWARDLTLEDCITFVLAPMPWKDEACTDCVQKLIKTYVNTMYVGLADLLEGTTFMGELEFLEKDMSTLDRPLPRVRALEVLESFHRFLGVYNWLALRKPVSFSDVDEVMALKERVERALHWGLEGMTRKAVAQGVRKLEKDSTTSEQVPYMSSYEVTRSGRGKPISTPVSKVREAQKNALGSL